MLVQYHPLPNEDIVGLEINGLIIEPDCFYLMEGWVNHKDNKISVSKGDKPYLLHRKTNYDKIR